MKIEQWHYSFMFWKQGSKDTKVFRLKKVEVRKWWATVDPVEATAFKGGFFAGRLDMWYDCHGVIEKVKV